MATFLKPILTQSSNINANNILNFERFGNNFVYFLFVCLHAIVCSCFYLQNIYSAFVMLIAIFMLTYFLIIELTSLNFLL